MSGRTTIPPIWRDRLTVVAVAFAASLSGLFNDLAHDDVSLILDNARAVGRYEEAKQTIEEELAQGDTLAVFRQIESIADSALAAGAPAGSIRLRGHVSVDDEALRAGPLAVPGNRP